VRYLSFGLLKIHRKLTSGYLLCDKASSRLDGLQIKVYCEAIISLAVGHMLGP
jgi:hypothetical protein